jgi:outer membrane protein TolC
MKTNTISAGGILRGMTAGMVCVVSWLGCSTPDEYFAKADKEVYNILNLRQQQIFGQEKEFGIETPYSARAPEDILPEEIILNRFTEGTNTITLAQALEMAVNHSRDYQLQRETLYLSALSLTGERHKFALKFSKDTNLDLARSRSDALGGGKVTNTKSDAAFTVSKALKAGGSLTASLANNLKLYFDGSTSAKVPGLAFALTQPLLRGSGEQMALESLTQSERNLVYAIRTFSRYQETFLVDRTEDYLNLLLSKKRVRVAYQLYQNRILFREEQELRLLGELISQFELDQALRSEYQSKVGYINDIESYRGLLDDFKKHLNMPLGQELVLDDAELINLEQFGLQPPPLTDAYGFQLALTNRLDVINEVDKFQDKKRKVKVAADDLLPSLKFVTDLSLKDQYYHRNSFDLSDYSAGAGLSLDLPLDKLTERNAYRKSRIDFEQQLRSLMRTLDDLRDTLRTNVRTLDQNQQSYIINQKALIVARRELEKARLDMLAGGRVSPRDIIEAQTAVASAENSVYTSLINFHTQRLKLLNNTGILKTDQNNWWRLPQQVPGVAPLPPAPAGQEDLPVRPPGEVLGN